MDKARPTGEPPAVIDLERGPWWEGRRFRLRRRPGAPADLPRDLPFWARVGMRLPLGLTLGGLALACAAAGGALLLVVLFGPQTAF